MLREYVRLITKILRNSNTCDAQQLSILSTSILFLVEGKNQTESI